MVDSRTESPLESQEEIYLLDESLSFKSLYQRASIQQWDADKDIDWSLGPQVDESVKESWVKIINVFYSLELVGLSTLNNMLGKTARKFKDINLRIYLSAQSIDEARHVYVLRKYMGLLGVTPSTTVQNVIERLGNVASKGVYTVENFLFSTLFSENFASMYLRMCIEQPIDPLAREIFKKILQDEGRHVKFQNIIMPYVVENASYMSKLVMKTVHLALMNVVKIGTKSIKKDSENIGINSEEFLNRLVNQLDRQYQKIGIAKMVDPQKIKKIIGKTLFN
mgnify:CR=1 FL=1